MLNNPPNFCCRSPQKKRPPFGGGRGRVYNWSRDTPEDNKSVSVGATLSDERPEVLESRQTSGSHPPGMKRNGKKNKKINLDIYDFCTAEEQCESTWTDRLCGASAWHVLQCRNLNFKCDIVIDEEYS